MFDFIDDITIHTLFRNEGANIVKSKQNGEVIGFNHSGTTFICNHINKALEKNALNFTYIQLDESEVNNEYLKKSVMGEKLPQVVSKLDFDMFDNDFPDSFFILPRKKYAELRETYHKYVYDTVFTPFSDFSEEVTEYNLRSLNEFLDTWYANKPDDEKAGMDFDKYLINKWMSDPIFAGNVQFYILSDIATNKVIGYSMISLKPSYDEKSGLFAFKYLTRKCLCKEFGRRNLTLYLDWITFDTLFQRLVVNGPMKWHDQDDSYIVSSHIEDIIEGESKKLYRKIWESKRQSEQLSIIESKSFLINWGCGSEGDVKYQLMHWPKFDVSNKWFLSF